MNNFLRALVVLLALIPGSQAIAATVAAHVDPTLKKALLETGLQGLVHGADLRHDLFVFSYHSPNNFFNRIEFSLVPTNENQRAFLHKLSRHDAVRVKGKLGSEENPQPHIFLTEIELIKKYDSGHKPVGGRIPPAAKIPEDLAGQTEMVAVVHAIGKPALAGKNTTGPLVVEYKDAIVPIFVSVPESARLPTDGLYRGDLVKLQFEVQAFPDRPAHLRLKTEDLEGKKSIEVLEGLVTYNEQIKTITGSLVLYPKSPTINRDIWAVEQPLGHGLTRTLTLVNFEKAEEDFPYWKEIDQLLRALWEKNAASALEGRNKLVNPKILIRATGKATVISASQANAQLHLKASAIEILQPASEAGKPREGLQKAQR